MFCCFLFKTGAANAQGPGLPQAIAEQFYIQYPYATDLKCAIDGNKARIGFLMKNEKYQAVYIKNEWVYTVMNFSFERLPEKIKEGFKKSRLAGSEVENVDMVYVSSGFETYRLQLKNEVDNKKYHYFSESGKLLHNPPHQD